MDSSDAQPLNKMLYIVGVLVIFLAVYSQYFVELGTIGGYLVVYGIPTVVISVFFGRELLKRAAKNNKTATVYGLGLFGTFTVLGIFIGALVISLLSQIDPQVIEVLSKPNPVLDVPPSAAWILIAVSMVVVGPVEEYLFRGFMYGGLLSIFKGRHWVPLAVVSSLLFAFVHAYYALTYSVASVVQFISLTAFGFAMCVTYFWSGGNLLIPAIIHGLYDATGFLGVAMGNLTVSLVARGVIIFVGLVFALVFLPRKIRLNIPTVKTPPQQTEGTAEEPAQQ